MTKDERQILSINKWREANGRGTLNLVMRFGKTKIADIIIRNTIKDYPNRKVCYLTANDIGYQNARNHNKKQLSMKLTFHQRWNNRRQLNRE